MEPFLGNEAVNNLPPQALLFQQKAAVEGHYSSAYTE